MPFRTRPCISSTWQFLSSTLCNKLVIVNGFQGPTSCPSKSSDLETGSWEPLTYSQPVISAEGLDCGAVPREFQQDRWGVLAPQSHGTGIPHTRWPGAAGGK